MKIQIPIELQEQITGKSKNEILEENKLKEKKSKEIEEKRLLYKTYPKIYEFYFEGYKIDGEINPNLFNSISKDVVNSFLEDRKGRLVSTLSSTKLRQYYDIINGLYHNNLDENKLKTELYIVLSKANYDNGRKNTVPKQFVNFLQINIDMIFKGGDVSENFKIFKKHFESVVAYSKGILSN